MDWLVALFRSVLYCSVRDPFFFLFPFVSTLLLFYATKEIVFFLRLIWNHLFSIFSPSIIPRFWKYYYENFSNANIRGWIWFIKGSCISLYRYFHSHIFTQSIFSIRWIVSFRYKVIRFFFPVRNRDSGAPFPRFYRFLMESVARW